MAKTRDAGAVRPPSPRQADALRAMYRHMIRNGNAPTVRELGGYLGVRLNAVCGHLAGLGRKGHLTLHEPARGQSCMARGLGLAGAPMTLTRAGLIPVVDPSTPAGKALLLAISEVPR